MKYLFKFVAIALVLFSCSREKADYLGPAYVSAPDGFQVSSFTATPSSATLASSPVLINANFTHNVTYIITITGNQSGAVHEIRGTANGLSNIEWTGTHDGAEFFRPGETVTVTLSFFGTSTTYSTTLTLATVPDFTTCGQFPKWGDFEDASKITPSNSWHAFSNPSSPIPNVEQGVGTGLTDYNGNIVPSVQGNNYYYIRGLGNQQNFVSGVQYTGVLTPVMPSNPDDVWVNMYIYGTGDPNIQVEIEYQESDVKDGKLPGYQGDDDDAMVAKITLDHVGWKLFSFQYSKLVPSLNALFGGSGNKIHEPHRIVSFDLILVKKSNPNTPVEVYFDFPILTKYGPFKPCK